jgi:FlaA1/EpsC-like NDP-sugar epimerase
MFTTVLFALVILIIHGDRFDFPRSVIPIEFFISLFLMLSIRMSKRILLENSKKNAVGDYTLIIASPDNANSILRTIDKPNSGYYPIAIISNSYSGMKINGIPVYTMDNFIKLNIDIDVAILDEDKNMQEFYDRLNGLGINQIKIASSYSTYGTKLHEVSVEDLLARHPQDLDKAKIAEFINNKTILITGAGGSIGSEIARQCVLFGAKRLILLDHSEFNLYTITEELAGKNIVPVMQSVVDSTKLEKTFAKYTPQIVIHAAAYKHVPLVEDNIEEAIVNNIIGTKNTIDLSIKYEVEKFVLISTDKAVRPTNVMGTTKRICELYLQNVKSQKTEIVAVRFGNVLGSSGSVIPKFKKQIQEGKNITVTHPDITRYFMLIPEACELVLQAGAIGKGGEIFILDMGEPIKIVDLAQKMIELSGKDDIEIEFSGLRAGEKLYEELLIDESDSHTQYKSITVAKPTKYNIDTLNHDISSLLNSENKIDMLTKIVPEFNHKTN